MNPLTPEELLNLLTHLRPATRSDRRETERLEAHIQTLRVEDYSESKLDSLKADLLRWRNEAQAQGYSNYACILAQYAMVLTPGEFRSNFLSGQYGLVASR